MKKFQQALCFGIASALALPIAGVALAQQPAAGLQVSPGSTDLMALLARASGMSTWQIQTLLGDRSLAPAADHDKLALKFRTAVGPGIYQRLEEGDGLTSVDTQRLIALAEARANRDPAPALAPADDASRPVTVISAASPEYPVEAARDGTTGYAVVKFIVAADGSIENARIIDASPRRVFDSAAILAVRNSTFEPAMKDGHPVAATLVRRIDFNVGG